MKSHLSAGERFKKFANAAAAAAVSITRPNYFESGRKGEFTLCCITFVLLSNCCHACRQPLFWYPRKF